jgi:uncharacterized protein YjiS (DUF1127 family)
MVHVSESWAMPARRPIFDRIRSILKSRKQGRNDRLDYEQLLRMSDHMLKDMGLTKDDVRAALMQPRSWL